jgi:hypothetical protein
MVDQLNAGEAYVVAVRESDVVRRRSGRCLGPSQFLVYLIIPLDLRRIPLLSSTSLRG